MAYDAEKAALGRFAFAEPHRAVYLNLFEAKAVEVRGKPSGEPKFSANFLLDPDKTVGDHKGFRQTAINVAKEMWPGRPLSELAWPWSDGDVLAAKGEKAGKKRDFYKGQTVIVSRTKLPPRLAVIENGRLIEYEDERRAACKSAFYMGVLCLAEFQLVAYQGVGANPDGVTAYLNSVISLKKGEKIGGQGRSLAETFSGYVGLKSDTDPTDGMDDDIPF